MKNIFTTLTITTLLLINFYSKAQWVTTGTTSTSREYTGGSVGIGITTSTSMTNSLNGSLYFNGITNNNINGSRIWFDGLNYIGHFDVRTNSSNSTSGLSFSVDNTSGSTSRMFISSNGFIGLNTTSPSNLLTVNGGDIVVYETNNYSEMPDGNGADLYLYDNTGASLDLFAKLGHGYIHLDGGMQDFTIGKGGMINYFQVYAGSGSTEGIVNIGNCTLPATPTNYLLYVKKGILTEKIKVASSSGSFWSDFVFAKNYKLRPLKEVENYINKNHHLPEIPSQEEVNKNGVDLLEMDAKLLQKIEELTLYMIEMEKKMQDQQKIINEQQKQIKMLKKDIAE